MQVSDPTGYRTLNEFEFNRINPELNVGFMPYSPVIISFPAVQATKFRLILSQIEGKGSLAEIKLSGEPQLEYAVKKQLDKMFPTPLPLWDAYQWPVQPEPEKALTVDPAKVIDISRYLSKDGTLRWNVPSGNWVIMRVGLLPTGITNTPAAPEGRGLEVDKLNKQALDNHFNAYLGEFLKRMPAVDLDLVWDAWTKPEILDQWWAPKPYQTETKSMDFREGGMWLYAMVSPENEKHWCKNDYHKVEPKKIFQDWMLFAMKTAW